MKAVLVTTAHRGVFFGYLESDHSPEQLTLKDARNCVYWVSEIKGFLGLATVGPLKGSKVGPKVGSLTLYGITSIANVTDEAVKVWESEPWSS